MTGARRGAAPGVRLRDVTLDDADLLDAWNADPSASGEFNDFGGSPKSIDREALARGPLRNERNGQLIIERVADGKPIGTVGWHAVGYGPNLQSSVPRSAVPPAPVAGRRAWGWLLRCWFVWWRVVIGG